MYMKKLVYLLLFFTSGIYASETIELSEIGTITVATESWEEATNEDGSGVYFDIIRAVYKPLGINIKTVIVPYERSIQIVKNGKADFWVASYRDEEDFPIYPEHSFDRDLVTAFFKKSQFAEWQGVDSLKDKTVAWIRGYDYDEYITDIPMKKVELDARDGILKMLQNNRVHVYLDAEEEIDTALEEQNFDATDYKKQTLLELKLYMAFANNDRGKALAKIWDQRMVELHENGELKQIYDKSDYAVFPF